MTSTPDQRSVKPSDASKHRYNFADAPLGTFWAFPEPGHLFQNVFQSCGRAVVRKNPIRLPSDRDAGTYLFGFPALGSPKTNPECRKIAFNRTDTVSF